MFVEHPLDRAKRRANLRYDFSDRQATVVELHHSSRSAFGYSSLRADGHSRISQKPPHSIPGYVKFLAQRLG